jgi:hypothetical protein
LEEAQRQAEDDRWASAQELTQSAHQNWENHDAYLHVFLRHSETDAIHILFREVNEFIRCEKLGEYTAANAQLITELELLAEAERLSVKNVL